MFRSNPRLSTVLLLTVGTFDLVTTLMWLNAGGLEGNRLFAWFAGHGSFALVAGKLTFLLGPVLLLEFARTRRPVTAEIGTWVAFAAYLYLYVGHLLRLQG